jgi:hypothetical protein
MRSALSRRQRIEILNLFGERRRICLSSQERPAAAG